MRKVLFSFNQLCVVGIYCEVPEGMTETKYRKLFLRQLEKEEFPLSRSDTRILVHFVDLPEDDELCSEEIVSENSARNVDDSQVIKFTEWGQKTAKIR